MAIDWSQLVTAEQKAAEMRAQLEASVTAERDRRIDLNMEFDGVAYQMRATDRENILGTAQLAFMAVMGGAADGDYRWASPDVDFEWIAADNTRVKMDAPTMIDFGKAVAAKKDLLIKRARTLKDMDVIPADFADDKWWS